MDFIKDWALGLILISAVGTVVIMLSPAGSMEKHVKTAVSIVLLTVCISPFFTRFEDMHIIDFEYETYTSEAENYSDLMASLFKEELIQKIEASLKTIGIKVENIQIDLSYVENGVSVQKVIVFIDKEHEKDSDEIQKHLKDNFGIIAETEVVS